MICIGLVNYVFVIGVEKFLEMMNFDDCFIVFFFFDGVGVVIIGVSDELGIGLVVWGFCFDQFKIIEFEDWLMVSVDFNKIYFFICMEGCVVFKWVMIDVVKCVVEVIVEVGIIFVDFDVFIFYQVNDWIIDVVFCYFKLFELVMVCYDIVDMGNIFVVFVLIVIDCMFQCGQVYSGDFVFIIGFGVGLVYVG